MQMELKQGEIGVYDSGVGGISFLALARRWLPGERFAYLGDLANAPYGEKSREFVAERARQVLAFWRRRGIKALVIACNTATTAAVKLLRAENPDLLILGMEPAVHLAVKNGEKRIITLATPLTVQGENVRRLLALDGQAAEISALGCPGLVELIEEELIQGRHLAIREYLQQRLAPCLAEPAAVVLGCTHYVFLRGLLGEMFPGLPLYDGNLGTVRNLCRRLGEAGLLAPAAPGGGLPPEDIPVFGLPQSKFLAYLALAEQIAKTERV